MPLSALVLVLKVRNRLRRALCNEVVPVSPGGNAHLNFRVAQELFDVLGLAEQVVHPNHVDLKSKALGRVCLYVAGRSGAWPAQTLPVSRCQRSVRKGPAHAV